MANIRHTFAAPVAHRATGSVGYRRHHDWYPQLTSWWIRDRLMDIWWGNRTQSVATTWWGSRDPLGIQSGLQKTNQVSVLKLGISRTHHDHVSWGTTMNGPWRATRSAYSSC